MSIRDRILKRRERFAYERAHWVDADPEESWFSLMTNIQRNNLYSLVLIGPAIFCILFYYFTGITPNIALSYLIIDMIVTKKIVGLSSGSVTLKKICILFAPSISAAS